MVTNKYPKNLHPVKVIYPFKMFLNDLRNVSICERQPSNEYSLIRIGIGQLGCLIGYQSLTTVIMIPMFNYPSETLHAPAISWDSP